MAAWFVGWILLVQITEPVPSPVVEGLQQPVARWVEGLHASLQKLTREYPYAPKDLAQEHARLGNLYQGLGFYDNAEQFYGNAMRLEPQNPDWPYFLGMLAAERNHLTEAALFLYKANELDEKDLFVLVRLGKVLLLQGKAAEAREIFRKAEVLGPEEAIVALNRARAEDILGNRTEAINYYRRALELQPQASIIHLPLGRAWMRQGRKDKAAPYLANPGTVDVAFEDDRVNRIGQMVTLATLEIATDMARDTKIPTTELLEFVNKNLVFRAGVSSFFSQAAQEEGLKPNGGFAAARMHYVTGMVLLGQSERRWALSHFRAATQFFPLPGALIELGNAYARNGDLSKGLREIEKALTQDPSNRDGAYAKANILLALGKAEDARPLLEKLLKEEPKALSVHQLLLRTLASLGDQAAETALIAETLPLLSSDGERQELEFRHAELLLAQGQEELALTRFRELAAKDRDTRRGYLHLIDALVKVKNYPDALAANQKLIEKYPTQVDFYIRKYGILVLSSKWKQAYQVLETCLPKLNQDPRIIHLLARFLAVAPDPNLRDGERAWVLAQQAYEHQPDLDQMETCAMALAQKGAYEEALLWQHQVLVAASEYPDTIKARLTENLGCYLAQEKCCGSALAKELLLP